MECPFGTFWLVLGVTPVLKLLCLCHPQPGSGCHPRGPPHRGHCHTGARRSPDGEEKGDCEEAAHSRNLR